MGSFSKNRCKYEHEGIVGAREGSDPVKYWKFMMREKIKPISAIMEIGFVDVIEIRCSFLLQAWQDEW